MRVLFINMSDTQGGSAKAAYRLGKTLEKNHSTRNLFLVRTKLSNDKNVLSTRKNKIINSSEKYFNILMNGLGLQYQYLPFSPKVIRKTVKEFKPDVISLHNTIGGYFQTKLLIELSQHAPIIWTLHDMWAFTANASYSFEDDSWKNMRAGKNEKKTYPWIGLNTGNWLIKKKKKIYEKSDFQIVTPSKWLADLAKQSPLLKNKKINQIYNGIDLNQFKPVNKAECQRRLGLSETQKTIMFLAEDLSDERKGGKELIEILDRVDELTKEKIQLIAVGKGNISQASKFRNLSVHKFDFISSEEKLVELYNSADLFIFPSKADNQPLVLLEAIACGTPCITFDTGGCGEMIINNRSGYTIDNFNIKEFAGKIIVTLSDNQMLSYMSKKSRNLAEESFSIKEMASNYFSLFSNIIDLSNK